MVLATHHDEDGNEEEPDILSRRLHQVFDRALDDDMPDELVQLARQLDRLDGRADDDDGSAKRRG